MEFGRLWEISVSPLTKLIMDVTNLGTNLVIPASRLGTGTADSSTYLRGDGIWATLSGGIGGTTGGADSRLIRSSGVGGSTIKSSGVALNDADDLSNVHSLFMTGQMRVTNAGPTFQLYDTDSTKSANFAFDYDAFQIQRWSLGFGAYEASPFYFSLLSPANSFWMNGSGNLGLGTITTPEKLTVNGNVQANSFIGDGSRLTGIPSNLPVQAGNAGKFLSTNGANAYWSVVNHGIGGTTGSVANKLIRSDGVGGITIKASSVTLNDTNDFTNVNSFFMNGQLRITNSGPTFQLYDTDSTKSANFAFDYDAFQIQRWSLGFGAYEASPFYFNLLAPANSFWMNQAGNLGLGTTTIPEKLTVNGGVQASSFVSTGAVKFGSSSAMISGRKTLSNNVSTPIMEIALPTNGDHTGGTLTYGVDCGNGSDYQFRSGVIRFAAVNKSGILYCSIQATDPTSVMTSTSMALTENNWTCTTGIGKVTINANFSSSLTGPVLGMTWNINQTNTYAITPL